MVEFGDEHLESRIRSWESGIWSQEFGIGDLHAFWNLELGDNCMGWEFRDSCTRLHDCMPARGSRDCQQWMAAELVTRDHRKRERRRAERIHSASEGTHTVPDEVWDALGHQQRVCNTPICCLYREASLTAQGPQMKGSGNMGKRWVCHLAASTW